MVTKDIGGKIGVFYWNYLAFYMIAYEISIGLDDPLQHALLCIEEPENQLYPELLGGLAEEFRNYANAGGQVFVSTHSPDFLNAVELEEIYYLQKKDGFTTIKKASDNPIARKLCEAGDLPGALWKQGLLVEG